MFARTGRLIDHAVAFVVLDGKAGTLAELAFLWALQRAGCLDGRPVVVWSDAWGEVTDVLSRRGHLDRNEFDATYRAAHPREAVDAIGLRERLGAGMTPGMTRSTSATCDLCLNG